MLLLLCLTKSVHYEKNNIGNTLFLPNTVVDGAEWYQSEL